MAVPSTDTRPATSRGRMPSIVEDDQAHFWSQLQLLHVRLVEHLHLTDDALEKLGLATENTKTAAVGGQLDAATYRLTWLGNASVSGRRSDTPKVHLCHWQDR